MPTNSHLTQLERKHRALETEIEAEQHRPGYDPTRLSELKRRKLTLKDRIQRLRNGVMPT